jgi:hypothetical protein
MSSDLLSGLFGLVADYGATGKQRKLRVHRLVRRHLGPWQVRRDE